MFVLLHARHPYLIVEKSAMSIEVPWVVLPSGARMPLVGLGVYKAMPGEEAYQSVLSALRVGYRHIDTAFAYGNEEAVGEGLRASGVPRKDIWLTTKLDNKWHRRAAEALDKSLANLGVEYVDLYLMHWPCSTNPDEGKHEDGWDFCDTWREMQKLLGTGKVKNIGVSNVGIRNMEKLLNHPDCKVCRPTHNLTTAM